MAGSGNADSDLSPALEAVLLRFRALVRSIAARHALHDDDLDALVQEVRIRLWRGRARSEEIQALPTSYVYQTAQSAAIDLVRQRQRREKRFVDDGAVALGLVPQGGEVDDALAEGELASHVEEILNDMVTARRVVARMALAGYGRQEIVERLGWSDSRVRNLLSRGMQQLREQLRERLRATPDQEPTR